MFAIQDGLQIWQCDEIGQQLPSLREGRFSVCFRCFSTC